ncbi:MAG: dephospho-CoA kinase [Bacteroidota bacterium]
MMIVGLTGGIGSGKSTVARMFKKLGVPVYDSDAEAKELMVTSKTLKKDIVKLLGAESYKGEELNRGFIADKVFKSPENLQKLNKIVHPAVRSHFMDWVKTQTSPYVIQETALIFENDAKHNYDFVILVKAPKEIRVNRVLERDGTEEQAIINRMDNQMNDADKIVLADFCIDNIDLETTEKEVFNLHERLIGLAI